MQCIVAHREHRGEKEYLVKWSEFESEHNSWETEEALQGAKPELLAEYESYNCKERGEEAKAEEEEEKNHSSKEEEAGGSATFAALGGMGMLKHDLEWNTYCMQPTVPSVHINIPVFKPPPAQDNNSDMVGVDTGIQLSILSPHEGGTVPEDGVDPFADIRYPPLPAVPTGWNFHRFCMKRKVFKELQSKYNEQTTVCHRTWAIRKEPVVIPWGTTLFGLLRHDSGLRIWCAKVTIMPTCGSSMPFVV